MTDKIRKYCPLCGNMLDPKIHLMKFGKTSQEMIEKQKEILKDIILGMYISQAGHEYWGVSLLETLQEKEDGEG